ncbi:unnamed protein product [Zymoseptoria tritici ST99CH_3D7]|uniref:Serine hydrolase domain-containing protein n=1 Tax=Zymoseptoria tritici (strain ST99CH_3D7) TaxID=1276538 RepID=A0A1X7S3G3_ZYMT9|nr:unnamed protein product [Zymoseptoria tritici ST99CH_3D7]
MVRILCLHGTGSSGAIFESQTAALRAMLPSHWEWFFINAELECGAHPELADFYPGPYYTPVAVPTVKSIAHFHDWCLDLVAEEGPFDGCMGFSAGACQLLGLMLKLQKDQPCQQPLFRFLILIAGNIPFSGDEQEGIDVTDWISFHREPCANLDELVAFNDWARENPDQRPDIMDPTGIHPSLVPLLEECRTGEYARDRYVTRFLHPEVCKLRLDLPTVHVHGQADHLYEGAKGMAELCAPAQREICTHAGGHEIPRTNNDMLRLKRMIEKAVMRSQS